MTSTNCKKHTNKGETWEEKMILLTSYSR